MKTKAMRTIEEQMERGDETRMEELQRLPSKDGIGVASTTAHQATNTIRLDFKRDKLLPNGLGCEQGEKT